MRQNFTPFVYAIDTSHTDLLCELDGCQEPIAYSVMFSTQEDGQVEVSLCVPHFLKLKAGVEHPHGEATAQEGDQ